MTSSWLVCMSVSCSVVSDSLQPSGLQPAWLLCPWDCTGTKTGVSSHFLLQGIFSTQGSNPCLLNCRQILYLLSHQGSPTLDLLICKDSISRYGDIHRYWGLGLPYLLGGWGQSSTHNTRLIWKQHVKIAFLFCKYLNRSCNKSYTPTLVGASDPNPPFIMDPSPISDSTPVLTLIFTPPLNEIPSLSPPPKWRVSNAVKVSNRVRITVFSQEFLKSRI